MSESICTTSGKTQYTSSEAKRVITGANGRGHKLSRSYKCWVCGHYHVTSHPESRSGRPKARRAGR